MNLENRVVHAPSCCSMHGSLLTSLLEPPFQIVIISYPFAGNGPWDYSLERPPQGAMTVISIALYLGETDQFYLLATDFVRLTDGTLRAIHVKHYDKLSDIKIFKIEGTNAI